VSRTTSAKRRVGNTDHDGRHERARVRIARTPVTPVRLFA
jgi:hypothetical protein